jgi:ribosomal protein S27AE
MVDCPACGKQFSANENLKFCPFCAATLPSQTQIYVETEKLTQQNPTCSKCGQPLTYIPQYERWYCYNDKVYEEPKIDAPVVTVNGKTFSPYCPTCGHSLALITAYCRWYCFNCKKYV